MKNLINKQKKKLETQKIKYLCKKCGWECSIPMLWGDLKPIKCRNKKCKTHFQVSPESLIVELPENNISSTSKKSSKKHAKK